MSGSSFMGFAFNRTRRAYLATELFVAQTHWSRFRGLMCTDVAKFPAGRGLWIVPCHGVHTFAMNFPIDIVYLDSDRIVVHLEESLKPWRMARVSMRAVSVLELPCNTLESSGTRIGDEIEITMGQSPRAGGA